MTAGARLRLDKMMLMRMTMCQASACGGIVVSNGKTWITIKLQRA